MATDSCRATQQQQRHDLETVERRDLPGNDASWYRALLGDQETGRLVSSPDSDLEETAQLEMDPAEGPPVVAAAAEPAVAEAADVDVEVPEEELAEAESLEPLETSPDEPVHFPPETGAPEDADTSDDAAPEDDDSQTITAVPPLEEAEQDLDNTSEMVGQLWTAGDNTDHLDVWAPDEMNSKIESRRKFRWTSLIGIVAVIGLVVTGLVLLPTITQNRADDHRDLLTTALSDLRGELPDTQTSLAAATDPVSTSSDLSDLATQLTVLTAKASSLDAAAQADLPAAPPLTSRAPIDELEPIRARIEPLGTVANTIQRRIANLVEYRTLMADFLSLPDLPITADSSGQAELRVTLASAQADSAAILAGLPDDPALADHRSSARDLNDRFATWQVDYLEALRTEDSVVARELLAELGDGLAELDNQLVNPLAQIRRDTDADLISLAGSIDEVVIMATEGTIAP